MRIAVCLSRGDDIVILSEELSVLASCDTGAMSGPREACAIGATVYSANAYAGSVTAFNTATGEKRTSPICAYPTGIAPCAGGLLIACGETDAVYFADRRLSLTRMSGVAGFPIHAARCADRVLVCALFGKSVHMFGVSSGEFLGEIKTEGFPNCALMYRGKIYVAVTEEGYYSRGSVLTYLPDGELVGSAPAGKMPSSLAVAAGELYCVNTGSDSVTVYDTATLKPRGEIDTPSVPTCMAAAGETLFLSCMGSGEVVRYREKKEETRVRLSGEPRGICILKR